MDVKDIILAASIAKGAGGSGGGVTKEYVDTQVGAVSERVDDVEDVIPSTATAQNKLATSADVSGNSIPSTSTTSPLTDSANGMAQGLTIYGRSEVVDGEIKSVGEGYAVVRLADLTWDTFSISEKRSMYYHNFTEMQYPSNPNDIPNMITPNFVSAPQNTSSTPGKLTININDKYLIAIVEPTITTVSDFVASLGDAKLCYALADPTQGNAIAVKTDDGTGIDGTMATFATALPLRSTLDGATRDELIIGGGKAEVITRCVVVDDSIVPLATPVTTPLTTAEISAFRSLRTFDRTTNITITDSPDFELDYLKNTENGQAVADIQTDLQGQIDGLKIKTLAYTGTGSSTNTITFPEKPTVIFQIQTVEDPNNAVGVCPFIYGETGMFVWYGSKFTPGSVSTYHSLLSYNGLSMTITGSDAGAAQNVSGSEYKVYYI